jgi:hypothetical protein
VRGSANESPPLLATTLLEVPLHQRAPVRVLPHRAVLPLLLLFGCDGLRADPSKGGAGEGDGGADGLIPSGDGFCGVKAVFDAECVACHSGGSPAGGLDLQSDAHGATVGVRSRSVPELLLVAPGDPEASLLFLEMAGRAASGAVMPPGGVLGAEPVERVRAWIADGARSECSGAADGGAGEGGADGAADGGDGPLEGWCLVRQSIRVSCLGCHSAAAHLGALDLESDPYTALVNQPSVGVPGAILVTPGSASGSLLFRKLSGTQGAAEGAIMPTAGLLPADEIEAARAWIDAGATADCGSPDDTSLPPTYHPTGWVAPEVHGRAAKLSEQVCIDCHGASLEGGDVDVSCDSCHAAGWRTDCTFCHGGVEDLSGAPPRDIRDRVAAADMGFVPHGAHVRGTIHAPFGCDTCHAQPLDVLSPGHLFVGDINPAVAEVDLSGGLSASGVWAAGGCSNLYCHGYNGLSNGALAHDAGPQGCADCHPDSTSGSAAWRSRMSGQHDRHVSRYGCHECHGDTVNAAGAVVGPTLHVNGEADLRLPSTMVRSSGTCAGTCHGEEHEADRW